MGQEYIRATDVVSNVLMPSEPLLALDFGGFYEEVAAGIGTEGILKHDINNFISGGASLYFATDADTPGIGDSIAQDFWTPALDWMLFQMQAVIKVGAVSKTTGLISFFQYISDPVLDRYYRYGLQLDYENGDINVWGDLAMEKVCDLPDTDEKAWIPIVLTIDYKAGTYYSLKFRKQEFDLRHVDYHDFVANGETDLVRVHLEARAAAVHDMWLDRIIIKGTVK